MNEFQKEQVKNFKAYWNQYYPYIAMELSDNEILKFINNELMSRACAKAADYMLSSGIAEVQE